MNNPFNQETLMAKLADAIVVKNEMKARVEKVETDIEELYKYPYSESREKQIQPLIAKRDGWKELLKQATATVDEIIAELLVTYEMKENDGKGSNRE